MLIPLLFVGLIISGIIAITTFFLYIRIRMKAHSIGQNPDPRERRYLSAHFISLFLFVLFGVLILVHFSDSINSGASYS